MMATIRAPFLLLPLLLAVLVCTTTDAAPGFYARFYLYDRSTAPNLVNNSLVFERVDSVINYKAWENNWAGYNMPTSYRKTQIAGRWTAILTPPSTATYYFSFYCDDGCRIWVNDVLVLNFWIDQAPTIRNSSAVALQSGVPVSFVAEWYQWNGQAWAALQWQSADGRTLPLQNLAAPYVESNGVALQPVVVGGTRFALADGYHYDSDTLSCSTAAVPLMPGWSVAQDSMAARVAVASHQWGASCLVLANGVALQPLALNVTCVAALSAAPPANSVQLSSCSSAARILLSQPAVPGDVDSLLPPTPVAAGWVVLNNTQYATLDGTVPSAASVGCQRAFLALPAGWSLAADSFINSVPLLGTRYSFGTRCLVFSNGISRNVTNAAQCAQQMLESAAVGNVTVFRPAACGGRMFITRAVAATADSWTTSYTVGNTISLRGKQYAVMTNNAPLDNTIGCQDVPVKIPPGWAVATYATAVAQAVASANFGTRCLAFSNGAFTKGGEACGAALVQSAGYAAASACPARVVLQRDAPSTSPCGVCYGWGDPHWANYDNTHFNAYEAGEMVVSRPMTALADDSWAVHTFHSPYGSVAMNTRMALRFRAAAGGFDQFEVVCEPKSADPPVLKRNGVDITATIGPGGNFTTTLGVKVAQLNSYKIRDNTGRRTSNRLTYIFTLPNGVVVSVYVGWFQINLLDIYVQLPLLYQAATEGLCGSCDGNTGNDFRAPNGTQFAAASPQFLQSWKVPTNSSLFTSVNPIIPDDFTPAYELTFRDKEQEERANKACQGLIGKPQYDHCRRDVAVTDDDTIASLGTTTTVVSNSVALPPPPPLVATRPGSDITRSRVINGIEYATLDNADPDDSSSSGCQSAPLQLPDGWVLVPDTTGHRAALTFSRWGTNCLVFADGNAYTSGLVSCGANNLFVSAATASSPNAQYQPNACASRILIMRCSTLVLAGSDFANATAWQAYQGGFSFANESRFNIPGARSLNVTMTAKGNAGAYQAVAYGGSAKPFRVGVWARAVAPLTNAIPTSPGRYCVWLDVFYTDSTATYGVSNCFDAGNVQWHFRAVEVRPSKPVLNVFVYLLAQDLIGEMHFSELQSDCQLSSEQANLVQNPSCQPGSDKLQAYTAYQGGLTFDPNSTATPADGSGAFCSGELLAGRKYGISQVLRNLSASTRALFFGGSARAIGMSPAALSYNFSVYLDIKFADNTWAYGRFAPFVLSAVSNDQWQFASSVAVVTKQIQFVLVYGLLQPQVSGGRACFDELFVHEVSNATVYASPGVAYGDPHLISLDGLHFDMQAVGEFLLAEDPRVRVQVRTAAAGDASVISACVIRGNQTLQFERGTKYEDPLVQLDGRPLDLSGSGAFVTFGDGTVSRIGSLGANADDVITYQVDLPDAGYSFTVTAHVSSFDVQWLQVYSRFPGSSAGLISGLLGNFDGDASNDLVNGVTGLAYDAATVSPAVLQGEFADSWRVRDSISDFAYPVQASSGSQTTTATFSDKDFAVPKTADQYPVASQQQAAQLCAEVESADQNRACRLDFLYTADPKMALSGLQVQRAQGIAGLTGGITAGSDATTPPATLAGKKKSGSKLGIIVGCSVVGAALLVIGAIVLVMMLRKKN